MSIELYDLAGNDPSLRFSPFCWRTKMALAHKGLVATTIPWRFTDKDVIAFSGQGLVPVIRDGDKIVNDSWKIAEYLDEAYPGRPLLFGSSEAKALTAFVRDWVNQGVHLALIRGVLLDIHATIAPKDRDYFRSSREQRFGRKLEEVALSPVAAEKEITTVLSPMRATLKGQPFIAGAGPAYADYILFGALQWVRAVSPLAVLKPDDALYAWRERMLDLYGGLARSAKGYPV
jgi:glutathione S-transferase